MRQNLRPLLATAAVTGLWLVPSAMAAEAGSAARIVAAASLGFAPAPGLPPGAEIAVLYGDPAKEGPFTVRFKFPAGYAIATHSHPNRRIPDRDLRQGTHGLRRRTPSEAKAEPLAPGSFTSLPAGAWHRLWIDADTVVELPHSTGPFGVKISHELICADAFASKHPRQFTRHSQPADIGHRPKVGLIKPRHCPLPAAI